MTPKHLTSAFLVILCGAANAQTTYAENFTETPFSAWETGWLGSNSSLTNYYGKGQGSGNNPTGLWVGETSITFSPSFADSLTSLTLGVENFINSSAGQQLTIEAFSPAGTLLGSMTIGDNEAGAVLVGGVWQNVSATSFSVSSTSGIGAIDFLTNGSAPILGDVAIANVVAVSAVPEPSTYALAVAGIGALAVALRTKRKARRKKPDEVGPGTAIR